MKSARYFLAAVLSGAITLSVAGTYVHSQASQHADATADTPDTGVPMTIEGLVRDIACPVQNHKSIATDFNLDCAVACARAGSPLVVLTKIGAMYSPISDKMPDTSQREKLMPFVGKYVRVSGKVFRRNGTGAIVIGTITEMKDVKLNTK